MCAACTCVICTLIQDSQRGEMKRCCTALYMVLTSAALSDGWSALQVVRRECDWVLHGNTNHTPGSILVVSIHDNQYNTDLSEASWSTNPPNRMSTRSMKVFQNSCISWQYERWVTLGPPLIDNSNQCPLPPLTQPTNTPPETEPFPIPSTHVTAWPYQPCH